jgi:dipeptidyl aminopeptidase/acylaminoacyl peptidase
VIRLALLPAVLVALVLAATAGATAPEGPRLGVVTLSNKPDRLELLNVGPGGADPLRIAGGGRHEQLLPEPLEAPSWSGDGGRIAFVGEGGKVEGSQGFPLEGTQIYVAGADGTGLRIVAGADEGVTPVLSPDGGTLSLSRYRERVRMGPHGHPVHVESQTIWLADLASGQVTRLTGWKEGRSTAATSFSPDGRSLAVARTKTSSANPEVVLMRIDGGGSSVLARNATDPVFSPDGLRIAFVRPHQVGEETTASLFTMNSDGSGVRRLTRTSDGIDLWPSWDPSGRRLVYTHVGNGFDQPLGIGDSVNEVNADGTCRRTILSSKRAAYYGATWQPGPGREAGPIAC